MKRSRFGNIRKRSSGRYQASYRRGSRTFNAPSTFEAKRDASNWLTNTEADILRGNWIDPSMANVTFRSYATDWLDSRSGIRASTRAKYLGLLNGHLLPAFGEDLMANVQPTDVRKWYAPLSLTHKSTAAGAYRLLSAIFNTAVEDEVRSKSPCRIKGGGAEPSTERPTATPGEVEDAALLVPTRWKLAIWLAVYCQLRRGEVLGLQRGDIDLATGSVRVVRAWTAISGQTPSIGPTKSSAGTRTLFIPPHVITVASDHLDRLDDGSPSAWLFPGDQRKGPNPWPANPYSLNRIWRTARVGIGRPDLRFHDLRHTGLTMVAATGATTKEIMRQGGHSNPAAALRYQHATNARAKNIAAALSVMAETPESGNIIQMPGTLLVPVVAQPNCSSESAGQGQGQIIDLTCTSTEQSQRGSNPCSHLERVVS